VKKNYIEENRRLNTIHMLEKYALGGIMMLTVKANLSYVDNGIIVEMIAEDIPNPNEDTVIMPPIIHRRVFTGKDEALDFVSEQLRRMYPPQLEAEDVLRFPRDS